jgi:hypothetical protein
MDSGIQQRYSIPHDHTIFSLPTYVLTSGLSFMKLTVLSVDPGS